MFFGGFFRFVALLLLVGLLAAVGVNIYNAGVSAGIAFAAMWLANFKPQAFYGTPSFALHLAEVARAEGYEPRDFGLKVMLFSGEPGASVPGVVRFLA